jgi:hypothetical protein
MPQKPRLFQLEVERNLPLGERGEPTRVSLKARFESAEGASAPSEAEMAEALRALVERLDAILPRSETAAVTPPRAERSLEELLEAYHPRQIELVDLLRDEGQLSSTEHATLMAQLSAHPPSSVGVMARPAEAGPGEPPVIERPLAALPLANDRTPSTPRPVEELLKLYRIESVKQAGAVRARRQISFDEYMAIKAHFARSDRPDPVPAP